jgi:flagellar protein FlaG
MEAEASAPTSRVAPARQAAADDAAHVRELAAEERARIAERLQEMARATGRELEFRVDEASDRMVIVVRDQSTGELIRQIPDATALRISQRLESQVEAMRSILFEGRV